MRAAAIMGIAVLAACADGRAPGHRPPPSARRGAHREAAPLAPRLPHGGEAHAPALVRTEGSPSGAELATDDARCEPCHAAIVAAWRSSAHAFASFDNPIYRTSVDRFRREHGREASRFCAGCHDVALLVDGAMDDPVAPSDPRAGAGVSCRVCHRIGEAAADGNGSYLLEGGEPVIPTAGDPASLEAHRRRYAPVDSAALCGSCHRSFLGKETGHPHHLRGIDDHGDWLGSVYAGSRLRRIEVDEVEPRACRDCHMPEVEASREDAAAEDGRVRSHAFFGGHTWLQAMRGDDEALAGARAMLRRAAAIDVASVRRPDGTVALPAERATLEPGERYELEVVVENRGAGHRFPGGTRDAQDAWIAVEVRDGGDRLVATDDAHRLRTELLDDRGRPALGRSIDRFRAVAFDRTVGPRDVALVRYALSVPEDAELPLTVRAELWHRSRDPATQRRACRAARSPRGRAFAAAHGALDACPPQPRTRLAAATVTLDGGLPEGGQTVRRLLRLGRAWTGALLEDVGRGREPLERAWSLAEGDRALAGAIALELARIDGLQGRIAAMDRWLARAGEASPGHPAIAWVRGQSLAKAFRHDRAVVWLRAAAAGAPSDPGVWRALAQAQGSAGRAGPALASAVRGLSLAPRDPDLLRVQALALRARGEGPRDRAFEAWLRHRPPDDGPRLRAVCSEEPPCERERRPAHLHVLTPPPPPSRP